LKELVTKELLNFKRFHVDMKYIKSPLLCGENIILGFPIERLLASQIFGIVSSQIEIEHIFSLAGILTNFGRCCLQTKQLREAYFC